MNEEFFFASLKRSGHPSLPLTSPSPCKPSARDSLPPRHPFQLLSSASPYMPLLTLGFLLLFVWGEVYFYLRGFQGRFNHCGHLTFSVVLGTALCAFFLAAVSSNQTMICMLSLYLVHAFQFFVHWSLFIFYIAFIVPPPIFVCLFVYWYSFPSVSHSLFILTFSTLFIIVSRAQQHLEWSKGGV